MNFIKKNVVSSCFAALFIILATVSSVFAIDIPGGDITVDETWTLTNSPYNILGNTVVQSGVTLTIQAGVEVRFNSEIFLEIHGKLVARGTEGNEIRFTSNTGTPASGDWEYIYFTGTSADDDATYDGAGNYIDGSILEYCIIEYAGSTYEGALRLDGAHPFINNCTIQNNFYNGIYAYNLDNILKITNCIIINNSSSESGHSTYGGGIYAAAPDSSSPKLEMTDNTISNNGARGNGGGLYVHFSTNSLSEIIITNNTITNNNTWAANTGGGGVYLYSQGQISISENEFSDNNCGDSGGAIYIHHQTNSEPAIVSDNNIENNAAGDHGGGIYFHGYNDSGPSLNNNNKITNNLIINNTTSTLSPGGWGGGIFITGAYAEGNIIMCNSTVGSTSSHGGGICVLAGDVRNNIIYDNTAAHAGGGIYITTLQGNSVENNIIAGNTSQAAGGVWLSVHHIGASIVANNVIYNNNVTSHAGGLHLAWL
ncbi:MAG: right-handed parallel beta-helix repeat-containing protein, partial [Spirochaetota bacterium]|nr:right-handed parallel beta-helix repeat-containing protein [Spirochaetota bacterium]